MIQQFVIIITTPCQIPRVVSTETAADDASDVLEFPANVHDDTTALGTAYEEKIHKQSFPRDCQFMDEILPVLHRVAA